MNPGTRVEMTDEAKKIFPKPPFTGTVVHYRPHHAWKVEKNIRLIRDGRKTVEVWPKKFWRECISAEQIVKETIRAFAMSNWERFKP